MRYDLDMGCQIKADPRFRVRGHVGFVFLPGIAVQFLVCDLDAAADVGADWVHLKKIDVGTDLSADHGDIQL